MRVLVACEFSGIVREAFRARGHEAYSVDRLETEADPRFHLVGDAGYIAYEPAWRWDLMIAHPPCTYLAVSGARWMAGRPELVEEGLAFVRLLLDAGQKRSSHELMSPRSRTPWRRA